MFCVTLKNLRLERKLTQQNVADRLEISRSVLSDYESGRVEPTLSVVKKIADFFAVSADYLLGREDDLGNISLAALPAFELTAEEKDMVRTFRRLPCDLQSVILQTLHVFAGDVNGENRSSALLRRA